MGMTLSGSRQRRCHRAASTLGSPKAPHTPRSRQVGWAAAESQVSQHQAHPHKRRTGSRPPPPHKAHLWKWGGNGGCASRSHVGSFPLQSRVVGAGHGVPGVHVPVHAHGDALLEAGRARGSVRASPTTDVPCPGQPTVHAQRPHHIAPLIRARAKDPRQVPARDARQPRRSHLLRIVQGAPRLPDALPEALVRHSLRGNASPQPRRPPPGGPRRPRPPPLARPGPAGAPARWPRRSAPSPAP